VFSPNKSQSRYKRSAYVTQFQFFYVPISIHYSFSMRYREATTRYARDASMPLRTGLDKCHTPHFQCKSTTSKRKTLLRLTETELIFFAPVIPTILELQPTLRQFSHPQDTNFVLPKRNYNRLLLTQNGNSVET